MVDGDGRSAEISFFLNPTKMNQKHIIDFKKVSPAFESLVKNGTYEVLKKPLLVYFFNGKRRMVFVRDTKSDDCYSKTGELIGLLGCNLFLEKPKFSTLKTSATC